jgi:hypothetical protein
MRGYEGGEDEILVTGYPTAQLGLQQSRAIVSRMEGTHVTMSF